MATVSPLSTVMAKSIHVLTVKRAATQPVVQVWRGKQRLHH